MFKNFKKISLLGLFLGGLGLVLAPAVSAQINTGIEYGSATGLSGGNIQTTIARIIQAFLGVLGIVALVLIIYAGFLWMTAGGDDQKVTRAKQIMAQAVIGLAIVLSSFAITSFIVSRLVDATAGNGGSVDNGGGGGGGGGGGLGSGNFVVDSITPPGGQPADFLWPKNSLIRIVFRNGVPDPATVPGSVDVSANGTNISGTLAVSGNALIFTPTAQCTENPAYTCLPGNSDFAVSVSSSLRSSTGKILVCGSCSATFRTGDFIDTQNPTVSISSPINGGSISANSFVPVIANAQDDSAVAQVEFFADNVSLGASGISPWQIDWDTTGIPAGTVVTLKAQATDAVGNTALATPVTVTVRPAHCFNNVVDGGETGLNCGNGCGACAGGTCVVNSDCSSGLCQNGQCINRPRIDSVAPLSGGPGTLVTISGASFGAGPGEVVFMGSTGSGDEKVAVSCAPSAWTDTQLIVVVPEGAVSGSIQVTNTENLSDLTDDSFGNISIPNFIVNTQVKPGICSITPNSGASGVSVELTGSGFGDVQGTGGVSVAGRTATVSAWSGTRITMAIPNLLGGTWPVVVTAAGTDSNGASFSVPVSANSAPHITLVEPSSGPIGEYITITGTNFGNTPGKVSFVSGADSVIGDTNFPPACGNNFWRDTSVTVKVPAGLPQGNVKLLVTRSGPVDSDNTINFSIVAGSPKPGICRIDPSTGPIGTSYVISGERLGNTRNRIVFRDNVDASSLISAWNDIRIDGSVPTGSVTGRVYAVSAGADESNSLNFTVADCRNSAVCGGSEECCTDGTCRSPNVDGSSGCNAPRLSGSYRYRFSTGNIPVTPSVIEEVSCTSRVQSPTPYKDTLNACVNSTPGARFNIPMNLLTLNSSNIQIFDCGNGSAFDVTKCTTAISGNVTAFGGGQALDDGFVFTPTANLNQGIWYEGRISKAVTSLAGIPMTQDYSWHFRVRNSSDLCVIESVTVSPAVNKLVDLYSDATRAGNENISYTAYQANPADAVCNVLRCDDYAWVWQSDSNSAQVVNGTACRPEVRALTETPVADPAIISATAMTKTGTGELTIKFPDPQVINKWPSCQSACREAQVAVSFNTAVRNISTGTVRFLKCNNETCATATEVAGYAVSTSDVGGEHLAIITPPIAADGSSLEANTFYRVVVLGGENGIHSLAGANLIGTNYSYGPAQTPSYSWVFRSSDSHCQVDSVTTTPAIITTNIVGSYHSVTAVPRSAPDNCSDSGQRINTDGLNFSWNYSPSPAGAAELFSNGALNARPLASAFATSSCLNTGSVAKPVCGNGIVENGKGQRKNAGSEANGGGEECDLGAVRNGQAGSGCSLNCLLTSEPNATCGNGVVDTYTLGDGSTLVKEQCDLGSKNGQAGSGCSNKCLRLGSGSVSPATTCGNGDVADNEQCDLGLNNGAGSGCSAECLDEGSTSGPAPICGDNRVDRGEDCDPPNPSNACDATCKFTGTSSCTGAGGSRCCGNGMPDGSLVDPGENTGCDLGWDAINKKPRIAPGCNNSCLKTGASLTYSPPSVCGDGIVGVGETNDPGASGTGIDAIQFAHAAGIGNSVDVNGRMVTQITAAIGDRQGQTEFNLQCGFKSDANCPANTFLGVNSCCYPRAVATIISPRNGELNVCRNPLVEVEFDREMDVGSFANKFTVTSAIPADGKCPTAQVALSPLQKIWSNITSFFSNLISFVMGNQVTAAPNECVVPASLSVRTVTVSGSKHSFVRLNLKAALLPNTVYRANIDGTVKTMSGVPMGLPTTWSFTTGSNICSVDAVNVNPASVLFTSVYAGVDDPTANQLFTAQAVSLDSQGEGHPISPIAGIYSWQTQWASSDPALVGAVTGDLSAPSDTATVGVKKAQNGQVVLSATAVVADDILNSPSTQGQAIIGSADITVLLCKNPWPARNAVTNAWEPAYDSKFGYSFYYCRDGVDGNVALPELNTNFAIPANTASLVSSKAIIGQYLYTYTNTAVSGTPSLKSEGIGLRISANLLHLSPTEWYTSQGFKGKVTPTKVDGYEAITDGRTIYVSAPSINTTAFVNGTNDFTNIFSWSYTEGAKTDTQEIFKQIMANMRFAEYRLGGRSMYYDLNICSDDAKKSCTSDIDCGTAICLADRSKIRRDVKRLADLRLIANTAQRVKDIIGTYPLLASGTFLPTRTVSTWPSWTSAFSQELGGTPPVDPINKLGACTGNGVEASTCWSASTQTFSCPANSLVYQYYQTPVAGFSLNYNAESSIDFMGTPCSGLSAGACALDTMCFVNAGGTCQTRINYLDECVGNQIGLKVGTCGNGGAPEAGEQCEKSYNPTRVSSCSNGTGTALDTCGADCQWVTGACVIGKCGNGVVDTGEVCDNGPLNGSYGRCNASCSGIGARCGDAIIQQGEVCDNGTNGKTTGGILYPPNGAWSAVAGRGCSLDCHSFGDYCGDGKTTSPNEFCDGGSASSVDGEGSYPSCANTSDGRPQTRTRTCNESCAWNAWGACEVTGKCGDAIKDVNEQCDLGALNSNNGACLTKTCKLASCGDGFVYAGREACDAGSGNIDPSTSAGKAAIALKSANCALASCYYCTNVCTAEAVTGAYCGDGTMQGSEQCDEGVNNVDLNDAAAVASLQSRCNSGDLGACSYCDQTSCQRIQTPTCGDSKIDKGESCDLGSDNQVANSGCNNLCQCVGQEISSSASLVGLTVTQNPDYVTGAVQVSPIPWVAGWSVIDGASPVWAAVTDAGSPAKNEYFKYTFNINRQSSDARMLIAADNTYEVFIDDVRVGGGTNFMTVDLYNVTNRLTVGTHTLKIIASNNYNTQSAVSNPAGLWFRIVSKPSCNQVAAMPSCRASGYTILSDTNTTIASIVNPSPVAGNPAPATPTNATFISSPESVWRSWSTYQFDSRISGAGWVWYSSNPNTYSGANQNNPEKVTFTKTVSVPGVPTDAKIYLMADDAVQIDLNGTLNMCPTTYCPTGLCSVNQIINECVITTSLNPGNNTFSFTASNWNSNGGLVYRAVLSTDCGIN